MEYETVPLQQLLREIAGRTASEEDADAIRLAADTLDDLARIHGEIVDINYSDEIGTYYGLIQCPKCEQEVAVRPMESRPKCRCGVEWDFDVSAVGTKW